MMTRIAAPLILGMVGIAFMGGMSGRARAQAPKDDKAGKEQASMTPAWPKLQAAYDYDARKSLNVKEKPAKSETAFAVHVEIEGPDGEKAQGVFMRPKAEGVYPIILLLHGLTSDKETMLTFFGEPIVKQGVAVLALDAPFHGERKKAGVEPGQPTVFPGVVQGGCREWRRALDYLATRKDVAILKSSC